MENEMETIEELRSRFEELDIQRADAFCRKQDAEEEIAELDPQLDELKIKIAEKE